jgi:hypothetical protein
MPSISIADKATPALQAMRATLADRAKINAAIGQAVVAECQSYVADSAPDHHKTIQKLGASPTGFLGGAAQGISFESDAGQITVNFRHFWFACVGHDVDIIPVNGTYLAIPISADSYGRRLRGNFEGGEFYRGPGGKGLFYGMPVEGSKPKAFTPLYILVTKAHQPQDRARLPSDEAIQQTALDALAGEIKARIAALE